MSISERYWLTIAEAATATAASPDTIRRRLRAGGFPGARRRPSATGPWHIPVRDLTDGEWDVDLRAVEGLIAQRGTSADDPLGAPIAAQQSRPEPGDSVALGELATLAMTQAQLIQTLLAARCACGGTR